MLDQGCVYPTFYSKLLFDLREEMAETTRTVRKAGNGVWAEDSTINGITLESRDQLTDDLTILPKPFRRLAEYRYDQNLRLKLPPEQLVFIEN